MYIRLGNLSLEEIQKEVEENIYNLIKSSFLFNNSKIFKQWGYLI